MKTTTRHGCKRLAIVAALVALPQILFMPASYAAHGGDAPPPMHADAGEGRLLPAEMPGPGMPPGEGPMLPHEFAALQHMALSEAQQDAVFDLIHAYIPIQRALEKKSTKALDELHRMASSDAFNARQARALADAHAQAVAQLAYNRAELDSKLRALLTPEQRRQLDAPPGAPEQALPPHPEQAPGRGAPRDDASTPCAR